MFYPGRNAGELLVIGTRNQFFKVIEIGATTDKVNLALILTNAEIESKFKELVDAVISQWRWHCYIHVVSRIPPVWRMWAGATEAEPERDWYVDKRD